MDSTELGESILHTVDGLLEERALEMMEGTDLTREEADLTILHGIVDGAQARIRKMKGAS